MKITIDKTALLQGLTTISHSVSSKPQIPILSNILLEANNDNQLILTANDLSISITTTVDANVSQEGSILLPFKKLLDVIKQLSTVSVDITVDSNNTVLITSGNSLFKFYGIAKDEFPLFKEQTNNKCFIMKKGLLLQSLKYTTQSISTDYDTRTVLTGLLFEFNTNENRVNFVSTDGRRLTIFSTELQSIQGIDNNDDGKSNFILPYKTICELQRLLKEEGEVKCLFSDTNIVFDCVKTKLTSKFIEGTFPSYKQLVNRATSSYNEKKIILGKEMFLQLLKRVSVLCNEIVGTVQLKFTSNSLEASCSIESVGNSKETVDISYQYEEFIINFNAHYLCEILKVIHDEYITLHVFENDSAGIIKIPSDNSFYYLIMPIYNNNLNKD